MAETTQYLLIGGFAAGQAAQSIRKIDPNGRIIIVGKEQHPPYDRPPLSKQSLTDDSFKTDDPYSKLDNYYPDNNIELRLGHEVVAIDRAGQSVMLDHGNSITYEKLLIATGATPKTLDIPGSDLEGIHYLRTIEDSAAIREALREAQRVLVIGTGYMGMEVISGAVERKLDVTAIAPGPHPWDKFASPQLGQFLTDYYTARNVKFSFGDEVTAFTGDGKVTAAQTKNGQTIEVDAVIACVGVQLNTQLAQDAGLEVDEKEGVMVDTTLQTSDPHIWVAGDIACFADQALDKRWHAEHFMNAKWQGQAVGAIMAGEAQPYDKVAYFFSDFLDLRMILRGDPQGGKQTTILGNLQDAEFIELYADDVGVLKMGLYITHDEAKQDPVSDKLEELIRGGTNVKDLTAATFGL